MKALFRVGRDRILEAAAVAVAFDHQFDEGLVHHIHLRFAVAVGEVHLLPADDGGKILQVRRNGPVQRDVRKRRLRTPAGRRVDAEDEALDALLDFGILQLIHLHKWREVGVKGGERLGAGPLVLHDAEEVYHLVAEGGQVACGGGVDLAGDAEAFGDQLLQAPARAVARQHAQVVQVQVAVAVGIRDLLVIDLAQPVVGRDRAGVGEDQTADGIGDGGVFLHAPVRDVQVLVDRLLVVEISVLEIAHFLALLAVENIGLAHRFVARAGQHRFRAVLNILHRDQAVPDLRLEIRRHLQGQKIDHALGVIGVRGLKRLLDGGYNLADIETDDLSVPLDYVIHVSSS